MNCQKIISAAVFCALLGASSCGGGQGLDSAFEKAPSRYGYSNTVSVARNIGFTPLEQAINAAPRLDLGQGRSLVAIDSRNLPEAQVQSSLRAKNSNGNLVISSNRALPSVSLYLSYDASREHVLRTEMARRDGIGLAVQAGPGLLALGVVGFNGGLLDTQTPLATVVFASGADLSVKVASKANNDNRSAVRNLAAVDGADSTATLSWSERNTGDYDLNSEVNIADLTPIGQHYQETYVDSSTPGYAEIEVVDGDENKEVFIADLTPIGANFGTSIGGYDVFRTPLSSADEIPLVSDTGRWTKVPNDSNPQGPSAPRDQAPQKTRFTYTFHDTSCGDGDFGWYVVALDSSGTSSTKPGNVATITVTPGGPPPAGLTFEIQDPATDVALVNDEFYLAVKINNITGLFSANVRFEYDASLVELVESVSTYTDHPNFLDPPLFLAVDDVGPADSPYKLLGFNATQTQGTAVKDGSGALGYFKFKALAPAINAECFRFPQSSNFIYLWGIDYGVPIATAALGAPQSLEVTNP